MHPTWRDLVIERLADDDAARRRFLERCGPHGAVLALSVGGGAAGERRLPLLRRDEDWDALGDRVHALLADLEPPELIALLGALRTAMSSLSRSRTRIELEPLAVMVLTRVDRLCLHRPRAAPLPLIDAWLQVSKRLAAPRTPSLAGTWAELLPVRPPSLDDAVEMQRLADWLALGEMLAEFSPTALDEMGFGAAQTELLQLFLQAVNSDQEQHADERLLRAVEAVAVVAPELSGRALRHAHWIRDAIAPALPSGGEGPRAAPSGDPAAEGFSVSRVLADL